VLLAVGYPSVVANVSNTVGLVPGGISGVIGYRRELVGQWRRAITLACGTSVGALIGGILLLSLPTSVFDAVVPILILLAVVLMALPKRTPSTHAHSDHTAAGTAAAFGTGIYGGYFGAAQGIILLATLGVLLPDALARTNALKNVLAFTANSVAAAIFVFTAHVNWTVVLLIAIGSVVGARLGAMVGKRVPVPLLRGFIVVLGLSVGVKLLLS